eukprot:7376938-Prymnesium_polylepis.1
MRCCGVPFLVGFAAPGPMRIAYRDAIVAGHAGNGDTRPLARILRERMRHSWELLERVASRKQAAAQAESDDAVVRSAREKMKKEGSCVACLGEEPDAAMLCCGAAVHIGCMADWLTKKQQCPTCRSTVPLRGKLLR